MIKTKNIILLIIIISISILSCNNDKNDNSNSEAVNSSKLIERDTLVKIIVDIHKIDGLILSRAVNTDNYSRESLYFSVFENYNVTNQEFNKTIRYYTVNDVRKLHEIYSEVLGILNQEKAELTEKLKN